MCLVDSRVTSSKAKLIIGEACRKVDITSMPFQHEFLEDLRRNWEEADGSIRSDIIDGFTRFAYHYNLCEFPQQRIIGETKYTVIEGSECQLKRCFGGGTLFWELF
jgi:hypothetical protein